MKRKILLLALVLALVGSSYFLMAAVPTQPRVDIDVAVETEWDKHLEYSIDLAVSDTVILNQGGIDTLRILHLKSLDTTTAGIYYPFHVIRIVAATDTQEYGEFTEFLGIGIEHADWLVDDSIGIFNPSTTDTITVDILMIGNSKK